MTNALAKLDKATQMLAEAKTLDEVKHIVDIAEAARTYAKAAKLGIEASNYAAETKIRAERKAGEMLAQLERKQGARNELKPSLDLSEYREVLNEQQIPDTTAKRWQQVATIPEEKFEEHIAEVEESQGELTTSGLLKSAKIPHVSQNSGENEWYTPVEYIEAARTTMGRIDLDPASSKIANKTVMADKIYTADDDGLSKFWAGKVWMNPPYSTEFIRLFTAKFAEHVVNGDIQEGIVLVNNATETNWFQSLLEVASAICLVKGRIKFIDKEGHPSGAPLQGQVILYFGNRTSDFGMNFGAFGKILNVG